MDFDLDFELYLGSINLMLGENGIGKSTVINQLINNDKNISLCFQHRIQSINSARVCDLLELLKISCESYYIKMFEIDKLLHKEINKLSGGENQILKIAISLSENKKIYIFDEPTQYLDKKNIELLRMSLQDLCLKKIVLVVEHNEYFFQGILTKNILLSKKDHFVRAING